jgi:hypothetical protein
LSDVTAVGSGSIITAAERTKVALVDVSSSVQGHLDLKYDSATAATQLGLASTDRTAIRSEFAAADGLVASASATARGVIQADVDANEADGDADRVLIRQEFVAADVVVASASATARGVIQADVDQNEADGDADRVLIRQEFAAADVVAAGVSSTARGVIQADVDQNEADGDADRAAIRSEFQAADAAAVIVNHNARGVIQTDVDQNEATGVTDRALIRTQYAAADLVLTNAVAAHTVTLATKQDTIANDHLQIAHTAGLQTALDARLSSTGENQAITQNSSAAILTLTNLTADTKTLSCRGGDGSISIVSGVAVECDRQGPMYVRNNMGAGAVVLQARSTNAIVIDDKVTVPISFILTKAGPNTSGTAGTQHEIRVDDSYIYVKTSGAWKRIALSVATW